MTVKLMLTCLCDALYGEVGIATVRVLEHAGCTVEFPKEQTCCGQPPFNGGDWESARIVAKHWKEVFSGEGKSVNGPSQESGIRNPSANSQSSIIVSPSSSCTAMVREGFHLLFPDEEEHHAFELGEFLVHKLGIEKWPVGFAPDPLKGRKVAYHRACHGRGIGLKGEQEMLLRSIPGIELIPIEAPEQCCGFGGAFSVGHPTVSAAMGMAKLKTVSDTGATLLVSGDMGCLMHLSGLIARQGLAIETKHFAEILAGAIPASVPA